jgi:hypothetical protein
MKKAACAVLLLIMTIFLVNPMFSDARGGGHRGGHWGGRGWWAPWAVIGGAAVLAAPYYGRYYGPYYSPYYDPYYVAPPPVIVQEQPPVYVQPAPAAQPPGPQASVDKMFIYPRKGQDEKQQATDRYECHSWAAGQTGYDPTKLPDTPAESRQTQMRADYQRAMAACLDGRGYTMK